MAIIVTDVAYNGLHIQDAFRRYDRDYFPYQVYDALYDLIEQTYGDDEVYEIDVTGLCCDIKQETVDPDDTGASGDIDKVAERIAYSYNLLYVDHTDNTIYYIQFALHLGGVILALPSTK